MNGLPEAAERRALLTLFALNGAMFVVEVTAGLTADSMGLVADGLDMLADAVVYGLSLYAIGRPASAKVNAALGAGYAQLALAAAAIAKLGLALARGSAPEAIPMVGVSLLALGVNVWCLAILKRYRHGEVHLRAAWIFSATDVQVNVAVILAAILVSLTESGIPDLLIAAGICVLILRSVIRILTDAYRERRETLTNS
ncbi:MAG: cation transporter [Gemmatimonadaceae bacterium]|nr:cation transporter [Gemmatimonadaceae bacterium]